MNTPSDNQSYLTGIIPSDTPKSVDEHRAITTEIIDQSIEWNTRLDILMEQCNGELDTSNESFLSYTIPTVLLPVLESGIHDILPSGSKVILVMTNHHDSKSYIHVIEEKVAQGFLYGQSA